MGGACQHTEIIRIAIAGPHRHRGPGEIQIHPSRQILIRGDPGDEEMLGYPAEFELQMHVAHGMAHFADGPGICCLAPAYVARHLRYIPRRKHSYSLIMAWIMVLLRCEDKSRIAWARWS